MRIKLPRCAAVHDMSGYGKCSLTVAIPTLSAAGIEVSPVPTALLSTNTLFKNFTFFDFTPHMDEYISHWQEIGVSFDCLYSGFLGSAAQIDFVKNLKGKFNNPFTVIDPVMGDNGKIISIYSKEMCAQMSELVAIADVATPNVTEGCILAGIEYQGENIDMQTSEIICRRIIALGAKNVVLTGISRDNILINAGITGNDYFEREISRLPFSMHGTGDLFTSVLTAGLMRGYGLIESVDSAAGFVSAAMEYSKNVEKSEERGVSFEPLAYKLSTGIYLK